MEEEFTKHRSKPTKLDKCWRSGESINGEPNEGTEWGREGEGGETWQHHIAQKPLCSGRNQIMLQMGNHLVKYTRQLFLIIPVSL
ncbi:hypothetical protein BaRGS_00019063 [Batillaria attramentaria]|uniref:Uncharacterized protein n=1 Tax=Batillaria attramentaria TaxID=370345 RepID=A0ABD0KQX6_9CAEN